MTVTGFPALLAFALQAAAMGVDEFYFHRKRRLPRWERLGHPLDTLSVLACYGVTLVSAPTPGALTTYVALAIFSCLFVTKDEFVHAKHCEPREHWLHSLLFMLHPIVLASAAWLWVQTGFRALLITQTALTLAFGSYQLLYWNLPWTQRSPDR